MYTHAHNVSGQASDAAPFQGDDRRTGFTLVEVLIASCLVALVTGGFVACGIAARRISEHSRLAVEARSMGIQKLEEILSFGRENIAQPGFTLTNTQTNEASMLSTVVRRARVVYHHGDGATATAGTNSYAEVHVDVVWYSPVLRREVTNTFSTLVL